MSVFVAAVGCFLFLYVSATTAYTSSCKIIGCQANGHYFVNTEMNGDFSILWRNDDYFLPLGCVTTVDRVACSVIDTKDMNLPDDEKPGLVVFDIEGNFQWRTPKARSVNPVYNSSSGILVFNYGAISVFYFNGTFHRQACSVTETPYGQGFTVTMDGVFVATADHGLVAIDRDGNLLANIKFEDNFAPYGTPIVGDDGVVYVETGTNVYPDGPGPARNETAERRLYAIRILPNGVGKKPNTDTLWLWYYQFMSRADDSFQTQLLYDNKVIYFTTSQIYGGQTVIAVRDDGDRATRLWKVFVNSTIVSLGFYPNESDPRAGLVLTIRGDGGASGEFYILDPLTGATKYHVSLDAVFGRYPPAYTWITSPTVIAPPMNESFATPTLIFGIEELYKGSNETTITDSVAIFGMDRSDRPIWQTVSDNDGYRVFYQVVPFAPDETGQATQMVVASQSTIFSFKIR
eukprot:m.233652 g.233652  ORF g.233652 m.233652 type:complete len:461 (+) comp40093_c3_seq1:139-1521(+)